MDDMIRFSCPSCGKRLKAPPAHADLQALCSCGQRVVVPSLEPLPLISAVRPASQHNDNGSVDNSSNNREPPMTVVPSINRGPSVVIGDGPDKRTVTCNKCGSANTTAVDASLTNAFLWACRFIIALLLVLAGLALFSAEYRIILFLSFIAGMYGTMQFNAARIRCLKCNKNQWLMIAHGSAIRNIPAMNRSFEARLPEGWEEWDDPSGSATLQCRNVSKNCYMLIFGHDKVDYTDFVEYYQEMREKQIEAYDVTSKTGPADIVVMGRAAVIYRLTWRDDDDDRFTQWFITVDGVNRYYTIMMWSTQKAFKSLEPSFQLVLNGLREIS